MAFLDDLRDELMMFYEILKEGRFLIILLLGIFSLLLITAGGLIFFFSVHSLFQLGYEKDAYILNGTMGIYLVGSSIVALGFQLNIWLTHLASRKK
jgi:hypothetical protein